MNAESKLARQRLSVLQLAEALGNVAEACRRRGISRTQFYEHKRRFQTHGIEGLKDLPPIARSHPNTTPPEVVEEIKKLALKHPSYGCNRLEALLKAAGHSVSYVVIQKILNRNGLGTRYDRWLALEQKNAEKAIKLTGEQVAFIEKHNPCFKERHVESSKPGELLNQDTFFVEHLKACGTDTHPYQIYLEFNDIAHRTTRVRRPQSNGFIERFNRTVLDEFFRVKFRQKMYHSLQELQQDLDVWLKFYNQKRPHLGYRNMGRTPLETIKMFKQQSAQKDS